MTQDEYIELIEREPLESMVVIKEEYRYIPISVIQAELRLIYRGNVKWEMLRETVTRDGVYGVGKLWYLPPYVNVTQYSGDYGVDTDVSDWIFHTGTAAIPITKKLRLSYPSLEAHCILNAVKKIGPWFGSNLNKQNEDKDLIEDDVPVIQIEDERLIALIENASTLMDLSEIKRQCKEVIPDAVKPAYHKKLKTFVP